MIKLKLRIITLFGLMTFLISCNSSTNNTAIDHKTENSISTSQIENTVSDSKDSDDSTSDLQVQIDSRALNFIKSLKNGEKLSSFFTKNLMLIYHEDNRCEGSTDGQVDSLINTQIDSLIKLNVKNDGDGWACDKKEPTSYEMDFDLKKKIAEWDRFEILKDENQEENIVYIVGAGEFDYLKLYYNDNNLIVKLEYRSEDPG
jgi:hypothetical protein